MTGSEKSPPGGDTLRKQQQFFSYRVCTAMSPSSGLKWYSRSYDADAALPLRVAQTLHPSSTLIEGGETGAEVGRITTVCGQIQKILLLTGFILSYMVDMTENRSERVASQDKE